MLGECKDLSDVSPRIEQTVAPVPFPARSLNAQALPFEPLVRGRSKLRAAAAEFVPSSVNPGSSETEIVKEVISLVESSGCVGVNLVDLPTVYRGSCGKPLDLDSMNVRDLSSFIRSIPTLRLKNNRAVPISIKEALLSAGFREAQSSEDSAETMGCRDTGLVRSRNIPASPGVGVDFDKVVVHVRFEKYVDELRTFRESIIEVISSFMSSTTDPNIGLCLSLFSSEWDKFFVNKGLSGMPGFKALRERFSVVKLMSFLQSIPGLEVVGSHPEIRVKVQQPSAATRPLVLNNELPLPRAPLAEIKQHISPSLVSQLMTQVDRQVLELGSFLATKGPQSSSQDLVLIRLQLQQLHCLKTSLQAVLRPLPIATSQDMLTSSLGLPAPTKTASTGPSTAATSRKVSVSPTSSARNTLGPNDFVNLIYRLIEKACTDQQSALFADPNPCLIGIPVNRIKDDWTRRYPSLNDLGHYLEMFKVVKLKDFLSQPSHFGESLVLFYSTLPSPQLRVSTRAHFAKFFKPDHPGSKLISVVSSQSAVSGSAPLISPSSTCSYTSDMVGGDEVVSHQPTSASDVSVTNRQVTELILKKVRQEQIAIMRKKAVVSGGKFKTLIDLFDLVESIGQSTSFKNISRPLDSRRPPPIDTGSGNRGAVSFPALKTFVDCVTSLIITDHLFGSPSEVVGLPVAAWAATWQTEYPDEPVFDSKKLSHVPGIRICTGSDGVKKCTVAALSTPSAAIASLFNIADKTVWNNENKRLVDLVNQLVSASESSTVVEPPPATCTVPTTNQLSQLSAVIFESIMSGGPSVARKCASALRVLAAQDPKAIHEIISDHVARLKNTTSEDAADKLIRSLISRSEDVEKNVAKQQHNKIKTDDIRRMMGIASTSYSSSFSSSSGMSSRVYSKSDLLGLRRRIALEQPLAEISPPQELMNLRLFAKS